jgi:hypothetical protein
LFTNLVESIRTKLPPNFERGERRPSPKTLILLTFLIRPARRCVPMVCPAGKPGDYNSSPMNAKQSNGHPETAWKNLIVVRAAERVPG